MTEDFANSYFKKYGNALTQFPQQFFPLDLIVVIPCFNEPDIGRTIHSLEQCEINSLRVACVVVVNSSEVSPPEVIEQNRKTMAHLTAAGSLLENKIKLFVVQSEKLPKKHAGVGWARKIGMDWAVAHFSYSGNRNGVIVSLDADTFVEENYLTAIWSYFQQYSKSVAATIAFEHRIETKDSNDQIVNDAIVWYELYMRYYRNALRYVGFPASFYTVGSCFAVRADAYVAQGGMNWRQAGEDFYFLHKIATFGEVGEINSTTVFPSDRISDRVPFGTGPVIRKFIEGDRSFCYSYALESFLVLNPFFMRVADFYSFNGDVPVSFFSANNLFQEFLLANDLVTQIVELAANCGSCEMFTRRFFHLFNAFIVLKWLNFAADHPDGYPREYLPDSCAKLLALMGVSLTENLHEPKLMLNLFRQVDKDYSNH